MSQSALYAVFSGDVMLLAIAMTRMVLAFMMLPVFASQVIPPLVRNSIMLALTLIVLAVHEPLSPALLSGSALLMLFAAEALIGISLGLFFGLFLWAFETAGEMIDTAVGSSIGMIFDPISGNEVTLIGVFLGRFANLLFMVSGGMLLITTVVLQSYTVWPLGGSLAPLDPASMDRFAQVFADYFTLALMIAAPTLVLLFLIDLTMGLINRFTQQLNVLFLSISIKSMAALLVLLLLLGSLATQLADELLLRGDTTIAWVEALFR